jgi:hypothetical protein
VAELWVSHQLKDKIYHLDPTPGAAKAARPTRAPEPELEGRAMTLSHDHANEPATGRQLAGASHRADTAARCTDEHAQAARSVDCECQAQAGAPCGPAGDHLARYLRAHHSGALTKESLTDIIADLDVIAPRAFIQPPSERAAPSGATTNADPAGGAVQDALAPGGEALGRSHGRALAVHTREEPELEAGS